MRLARPFDTSLPRAADVGLLATSTGMSDLEVRGALEALERHSVVGRVPPQTPDDYERWAFLYPSERESGLLLADLDPRSPLRGTFGLTQPGTD